MCIRDSLLTLKKPNTILDEIQFFIFKKLDLKYNHFAQYHYYIVKPYVVQQPSGKIEYEFNLEEPFLTRRSYVDITVRNLIF